jgi:peptidylprolyl isomerase
MTEQQDYYAVLEIEPAASAAEIERAYERLARLYQPDPDQDPVDAEKMRMLDEAFDTLDDPARRAAYDRSRGLPEPSMAAESRPLDFKTLLAAALIIGGAAALVAGIVLSVLVILDEDSDYTTLPSGLMYRDVILGTGPMPEQGQTLAVHYTGTYEDGEVFDTSLDGDDPITFVLGAGEVIQGWEEGLATMMQGGTRELIIPPDLAYGETGQGPIPPNATLHFRVQLVEISEQ